MLALGKSRQVHFRVEYQGPVGGVTINFEMSKIENLSYQKPCIIKIHAAYAM